MDLWVTFWSALTGFISDYGLTAVALIVLLRSAAIPLPVPADLLVVAVGSQAREQGFVLWPAWLLLSAATIIGAVLFYTFVRWIGQGDATHYGRYIGLTAERLSTAETQLAARGARGVFVARIVPGLRLAIVAVCGMLRFRWWKFVAAVTVGALMYVGICVTLGYVYGQGLVERLDKLVFPLGLLEPLVGLSLLLFWLIRARHTRSRPSTEAALRRSSRVRVGVLSGAIAISGSTMLVNALIYLAAPIAATLLPDGPAFDSVARLSGGLDRIIQAFVGAVALGIALGAVYAVEDGRWAAGWNDWLRGLAFGALTFALVALVQFVIAVQRDRSLTSWLTPAMCEAIRWGAYGVLVGLIYPVLRARRVQGATEGSASFQTRVMHESPGESHSTCTTHSQLSSAGH